jgi:hypothetical protein
MKIHGRLSGKRFHSFVVNVWPHSISAPSQPSHLTPAEKNTYSTVRPSRPHHNCQKKCATSSTLITIAHLPKPPLTPCCEQNCLKDAFVFRSLSLTIDHRQNGLFQELHSHYIPAANSSCSSFTHSTDLLPRNGPTVFPRTDPAEPSSNTRPWFRRRHFILPPHFRVSDMYFDLRFLCPLGKC